MVTAIEPAGALGNVYEAYLARLAPSSQRAMTGCLRAICGGDPASFPWHRLRREQTLAIRAHLASLYDQAPATANKYLAALRGILREAWRAGVLEGDAYARAVDLPPVRGNTAAAGRALEQRELAALTAFCARDGVRGARNGAVLALMYGAGLRVQEACDVDVDHLGADLRTVTVRGKGGKVRTSPFLAGADRLLRTWLEHRLSVPSRSRLLLPVRRGWFGAGPMIPHSVGEALVRLARRAGVARFTPHDLRRSYATHLIDAGAPLTVVKRMMGHSKVETTAQYDRSDERAMAAAAQRVSL